MVSKETSKSKKKPKSKVLSIIDKLEMIINTLRIKSSLYNQIFVIKADQNKNPQECCNNGWILYVNVV